MVEDDYKKAQKLAQKEYRARIAKGEFPFIQALDDIAPESATMSQRSLGTFEIPTWLIVGTKTRARQNSFAANFLPLLDHGTEFSMKWENLYQAQLDEGFKDAILVYEYLHRFYVQEGNKRVSVSRFLDNPVIMANVIRIMPPKEILDQHPVYKEFLDFYRVCPIYDLDCREPGSYTQIANLLGRSIDKDAEPWPVDLVESLRATYWHFTQVSKELQGELKEMPRGDAFLVYLRIYTKDALETSGSDELNKRIQKIRKELLTANNKDSVALMESSADAVNAKSSLTKAGSIVSKVIASNTYSKKHPLKAAFVYDRKPQLSDWLMNHERGRQRMEKIYNGLVKTKVFIGKGPASKGNKAEEGTGDITSAIDRAAEWGADVVFTVSPTLLDDALRAAIKYENIKFLNCSINLAAQAVRTYYARQYEAKFLAGVVAAAYADNHKIGYCSDYPIYGTMASINAFAIGAAMVDPDVRIYLEWRSKDNGDWWHTMEENGIRVISAVSSTHPIDGSQAYGVFRIEEDGTIKNLASPIWKWGRFYEIIIRTILDGTYNAKLVNRRNQATNYWWGMQSDVIGLETDPNLSAYTAQLVRVLGQGIATSAFGPFDGELRSQSGIVRKENDPPLTSKEIISMDWLNENVIGEIPDKESLNDEAKATVSVSGVRKK